MNLAIGAIGTDVLEHYGGLRNRVAQERSTAMGPLSKRDDGGGLPLTPIRH
jgi:hypothetical protein